MSLRNSLQTAVFLCALGSGFASSDDETAPLATRHGVLVFRTGRVVEGLIAETDTHYVVVRPVGKVEVPKSDVESVVSDLEAVYRLKASSINDRDPDEHVKLAHWCLLMNLRERAIVELERSAALSGDTKKVQGMIDALRRPATTGRPKSKTTASETIEPHAKFATPARQPTERELAPAAVSKFTLQIQPLLARSCGASGCHDTAHAGPFALNRTATPNARSTMNNLRSVLSVIDADDADRSPLITLAGRPHPRDGRGEMSNVLKDAAFAALVDWTRTVAGRRVTSASIEQRAADDSAGRDRTSASENSPPVDAMAPHAGQPRAKGNPALVLTPNRNAAGTAGAPPIPNQPTRIPSTSPPENSASGPSTADRSKPVTDLSATRANGSDDYRPIDPYDPEVFNRQFAPRDADKRP